MAQRWEEMQWAGYPEEHLSLLFFSSAPKEAASGGTGPSSITFFAFSLIEGYISIVMDAETQKKYVTPEPQGPQIPRPALGREEMEHQTLRSLGQPASRGSHWGREGMRGCPAHYPPAFPDSPVTSC